MWSSGDLEFGAFGDFEFRNSGVQEILSLGNVEFSRYDFGTLGGTLLRGSSAQHANKKRSGAFRPRAVSCICNNI